MFKPDEEKELLGLLSDLMELIDDEPKYVEPDFDIAKDSFEQDVLEGPYGDVIRTVFMAFKAMVGFDMSDKNSKFYGFDEKVVDLLNRTFEKNDVDYRFKLSR